ncbi:MAG: hypothetical protein GX434_12875 [Peptococcaceae bacterium]|nr:hypothetical protein [Peptococcaceae bacterium]
MDKSSLLVPIIRMISEYQSPGKKALQKLVDLIEQKGLDLRFNYSIHYYGPYSSELDYAVHSLEMQGLIDIRAEGMSHKIYLTGLEEESITLLPEDEKIIHEVLKIFASMPAHELELITTTDFVARELCRCGKPCTDQELVEGVKVIKGEKFSSEKIFEAISLLRGNGYRW